MCTSTTSLFPSQLCDSQSWDSGGANTSHIGGHARGDAQLQHRSSRHLYLRHRSWANTDRWVAIAPGSDVIGIVQVTYLEDWSMILSFKQNIVVCVDVQVSSGTGRAARTQEPRTVSTWPEFSSTRPLKEQMRAQRSTCTTTRSAGQ